jgi:hypothetical protein
MLYRGRGMDKILETIKSYLVGLGFQVNNEEYNQATRTVNELGKVIQTSTAGMAKNFAIAGTAISGVLAGVTASVAGLVTEVAKADLEYTKFANKMWTSKAAAKEMKMSMDALGESMEDIAFTPELRQQYGDLIALGRQMNTPTDAGEQLKNIRSIMFEFKKLKLEVAYAMEWVAYYLGKYLGGPLGDIKKKLSDLNLKITQTMPEWTKRVAKVLAMIMNVGMAGVRFVKDLYIGFERVFNALPRGIKIATMAILGAWALLRMSPIGMIMTAIVAVLVLLEDFYGYLDGRESSATLAPIWEKLIEWFKIANEKINNVTKSLNDMWEEFSDSDDAKLIVKILNDGFTLLKETLKTLYDWLVVIFTEIAKSIDENGVLQSFREMFIEIGGAVDSLILGFTNLMVQMGLMSKDTKFKGFWHAVGDVISSVLKLVTNTVKELATFANMLGLLMQGKYKEAGELWMGKDKFKRWESGGGLSGDGTEIGNFMHAIGQKESGGNYNSPAHMDEGHWNLGGKYQILAENWPSWAREAGLPGDAEYTRENQDIVASYKMQQMYDQYGRWDLVAAAWNGGSGGADSYRKHGTDSYEHGYVSAVMSNFQEFPPVTESRYSLNQGLQNAQSNYSMYNQNLQSSYQQQPSNSSFMSQSTFGNININIGGTNATTDQITQSVSDGITQAQERQTARNMREFKGVYGT